MKLRTYQLTVVLAAVAAIGMTASRSEALWLQPSIYLAILTFLSEWFAVSLPVSGSVSTALAINLAAVLLLGPEAAALVAVCGGISRQDIREKKPPLTLAFNSAQLGLSALLAGWILAALGFQPLLTHPSRPGLGWLVSVSAAAVLIAGFNIGLVGAGLSIRMQRGVVGLWAEMLKAHYVSLVALALLGAVFAQLYVAAGLWATFLLVVPFVATQQTFNVFRAMELAYEETLQALAAALEAKDPYTRGHSDRVARLSDEIARALAVDESGVRELARAALLHDIGKLTCPTSVLSKCTALNANEYELMRKHPQTGYSVLREVEFLHGAAELVRQHHERWDGRGYPSGLAGEEIDLRARILAVADSFDAMTSTRAYRGAMQDSEALHELRAGAGAQFDPRVVAVAERVIGEAVFE